MITLVILFVMYFCFKWGEEHGKRLAWRQAQVLIADLQEEVRMFMDLDPHPFNEEQWLSKHGIKQGDKK